MFPGQSLTFRTVYSRTKRQEVGVQDTPAGSRGAFERGPTG